MRTIIIGLFFIFIAGFAHADAVDDVVRMSQEEGIVSNYKVFEQGAIMSVRPVFHQMDIEHKRAIAAAFLLHAKRQRPKDDFQFILIRDSRNNNTVGNYDERLGLTLKKAYR
jgi:hypothetical protein